jgi:hypothetical protein
VKFGLNGFDRNGTDVLLRGGSCVDPWPGDRSRSRGVLAGLDDEDPDADRSVFAGKPCRAWTETDNKRVRFAYGMNYLIDRERGDRRFGWLE